MDAWRKLVVNSAFALAGAMLVPSVSSADVAVECDWCSNSQKSTAAVNAVNHSDTVFVLDYGARSLRKYEVNVEFDAHFGGVLKMARWH